MIPIAFNSEDHLDTVNGWMKARKRKAVPRSMLPETGCLVPGVAAGFLYQTDSEIAMLDHFVSNPAADYGERQKAMDAIATMLISRAKALGYRHLIAMTSAHGIQDRALRLGFREASHSAILVKEL